MKILCLSTYPVDEPRHGGQHRLSNIINLLEKDDHRVCSAGVLGHPDYPESKYFVKYPGVDALGSVIENSFLMEDWAIGRLFATNKSYFGMLAKKIPEKPDIILCEQPWLFEFAEVYNNRACRGQARIIYGSQNVEHKLKRDMVGGYLGEAAGISSSEKVLELEIAAITRSMLTLCVSEGDLLWASEHAHRRPLLVANGVVDRVAGMSDISKANEITRGKKFALYCASAHPPNMDGFFDIFGYGVGCFPPDALMVVAGGAGAHILKAPQYAHIGGMHKPYVDAGQVTEQVLRGLLATAHQIVLPIMYGGGTNLKAAEAIWSGSHVVATSKAMRGFEQFIGDRGISVADDPPSFCQAIRDAFMLPNLALTVEEREKRKAVLWDEVLAGLVKAVRDMEMVA